MEIFNRAKHYRDSLEIDQAEISSAFWFSPERNLIHSCLIVRSGRAHIQLDATPEQMVAIAHILLANADRIERMSHQIMAPIENTCGQVHNGYPCSSPAGIKCPDCEKVQP